jgi:hypothetical protein
MSVPINGGVALRELAESRALLALALFVFENFPTISLIFLKRCPF